MPPRRRAGPPPRSWSPSSRTTCATSSARSACAWKCCGQGHRGRSARRTAATSTRRRARSSGSRQLVSDLLDVARIDQGVFQVQPQLVDLGALVTEVAAVFDTAQHPVLVRVQEGDPHPGARRRLARCASASRT